MLSSSVAVIVPLAFSGTADSTEHEQAWTAFIQCQRIAVGGPVANRFTETINGVERPSNTVTTHTPDMTPRLTIEKWDEHSGWPDGDRDTVDEALNMNGSDTRIVFTITNASPTDPDTGDGPWFKASELNLTDQLVSDTDFLFSVFFCKADRKSVV